MIRAGLLAAVSVFAFAQFGKADVLYDNLGSAPTVEGPVVNGYPYGDSFSTGAAAFDVTSLTVSLFAEGVAPPPSGLTITAVLLADSSTSPGALLETIGTIDEDSLPAREHVDVTFNTSYGLAPDTRYWIELDSNDTSAVGYVEWDGSGNFSGTVGTSGEYHVTTPLGITTVDANGPGRNGQAFLMEISSSVAVLEPDTLVLFGLGLLGVALSRRRLTR